MLEEKRKEIERGEKRLKNKYPKKYWGVIENGIERVKNVADSCKNVEVRYLIELVGVGVEGIKREEKKG